MHLSYNLMFLQKGDLKNASLASYTHHVHNLEYNVSSENVRWYKSQLPKDEVLLDREAYVSMI